MLHALVGEWPNCLEEVSMFFKTCLATSGCPRACASYLAGLSPRRLGRVLGWERGYSILAYIAATKITSFHSQIAPCLALLPYHPFLYHPTLPYLLQCAHCHMCGTFNHLDWHPWMVLQQCNVHFAIPGLMVADHEIWLHRNHIMPTLSCVAGLQTRWKEPCCSSFLLQFLISWLA